MNLIWTKLHANMAKSHNLTKRRKKANFYMFLYAFICFPYAFHTLSYAFSGTSDDMDISLPIFSFSVWPLVVKVVSVARIIEIFCITRYQIKDMDILFPLVPHDQILVKWLGHSKPAKLGSFWWFSRSLSVAEIFSQTIFSKITPFKDEAT